MSTVRLPFVQIGAMWKRRTRRYQVAFMAVIELTPEIIAAAAQSADGTVKIWCIPPEEGDTRGGQSTFSCFLERPGEQ